MLHGEHVIYKWQYNEMQIQYMNINKLGVRDHSLRIHKDIVMDNLHQCLSLQSETYVQIISQAATPLAEK